MFNLSQTQLAQMSLYGQIGGIFASSVGSYFSAQSQKSNLKFQADMAEISARMSEQSAQSALNQGQRQAGAISMRAGQIKSGQRAALAANGVDLGTGNAAELQASTDIMKQIDMSTAEANGIRAAFGYRAQSVNYQNEAMLKRSTAESVSPFGAMATSLLGGATAVAGNWYQMKKAGMFDGEKESLGSGLSIGKSNNGFDGTGGLGLNMRF
ncbi:MAG: hypothetical protein ACKO0Z_13155 [Betaproteobacteria bacterium]